MLKKKKNLRGLVIGVLITLTLVLGLSFTTAEAWWWWRKEAKEVLNMGLIPAEEPEKIIASFQPMIAALEETLGMEVKPFVATDYAGVVEAMRVGRIDIAWFGPFSYILAADRAGAEAIAKGMDKKGETTYRSLIITHRESGIRTLNDLRGKDFAFVDPASTSGHLIPRFLLLKAGLDPERDFKSLVFSGGHEAVGLAVKHQKVDAGGMSETSLGTMVEKGIVSEGDEGEIVVLAISDPIPNSPIAVRKDMDPELKEKIKEAMLKVHEYMTTEDMGWHRVVRYVEARDEDYDIIREVQELLGL